MVHRPPPVDVLGALLELCTRVVATQQSESYATLSITPEGAWLFLQGYPLLTSRQKTSLFDRPPSVVFGFVCRLAPADHPSPPPTTDSPLTTSIDLRDVCERVVTTQDTLDYDNCRIHPSSAEVFLRVYRQLSSMDRVKLLSLRAAHAMELVRLFARTYPVDSHAAADSSPPPDD